MLFRFVLQVEDQSSTLVNTDPVKFIGYYNNYRCQQQKGSTERYEVPSTTFHPRSRTLIGSHILPRLQGNSLMLLLQLKEHPSTNAPVEIQPFQIFLADHRENGIDKN